MDVCAVVKFREYISVAASSFLQQEVLETEFSKEKEKAKGLEKSVKRKLREHKVNTEQQSLIAY